MEDVVLGRICFGIYLDAIGQVRTKDVTIKRDEELSRVVGVVTLR